MVISSKIRSYGDFLAGVELMPNILTECCLQKPEPSEKIALTMRGFRREFELVSATERLSEPRSGEFSRMADNKRSNRTETQGAEDFLSEGSGVLIGSVKYFVFCKK